MATTIQTRRDFERVRASRGETRSADRLAAHYEVEAGLARQLARSSATERRSLYSDLYRQLFETVLDHPQHSAKRHGRDRQIAGQLRMLCRWLTPDSTYVEVGCGDAALTKAVAAYAGTAIGLDVTEVLVGADSPLNFHFVRSDGVTLAIPTGSASLVYSNQLMEHLHHEDALAQLREIHRVLKPGGHYVCCTPNRLTGPHDVSVYFDYEPRGFHMREYDHRSLARVFRSAGFGALQALVTVKGRQALVPVGPVGFAEACLEVLPLALRTRLALVGPVATLFGLTLVGRKDDPR